MNAGGEVVITKHKPNIDFPYPVEEVFRTQATSVAFVPSVASLFIGYVRESTAQQNAQLFQPPSGLMREYLNLPEKYGMLRQDNV